VRGAGGHGDVGVCPAGHGEQFGGRDGVVGGADHGPGRDRLPTAARSSPTPRPATPTSRPWSTWTRSPPGQGQTIGQLVTAHPGSCVLPPANVTVQPYPNAPAGAVDVYIKQSVFPSCMANGLPARQAAVLAATQRPLTSLALTQKSGVPALRLIAVGCPELGALCAGYSSSIRCLPVGERRGQGGVGIEHLTGGGQLQHPPHRGTAHHDP
jgi:hypothetical protein